MLSSYAAGNVARNVVLRSWPLIQSRPGCAGQHFLSTRSLTYTFNKFIPDSTALTNDELQSGSDAARIKTSPIEYCVALLRL